MEDAIERGLKWHEVDQTVRTLCNESEETYVQHSFDHTRECHLEWQNSSIRHFMDQVEFGKRIVLVARRSLSPYPYHYQQLLLCGEFPVENMITAFIYYRQVVEEALNSCSSYESIPSVTAIGIVQELGIGYVFFDQ